MILHLYSDWKWTGPADPTVQLCKALLRQGRKILLACRRPPIDFPQSVVKEASERDVPVTTELHLNRYLAPWENVLDFVKIRGLLREHRVALIHCHLTHDHVIGGWGSLCLGRRIPVIRTNHKGISVSPTLGNRWLLTRWTDGLIEFSRTALQQDRTRFAISKDRLVHVFPAVDLNRFDPAKVRRQVRSELCLKPNEILVGIAARMQRHRRFDVLLKTMALLKDERPSIKLMILGRGTYQEMVAKAPARHLGLGDHVLFPGYRTEDYLDYLGAMDIKVFLVPGSDGTCRAVREAMALGKPVVASRRGMLPEIVEQDVTGIVVEDTPEMLAKAILELARRPELRLRMGEAARMRALRDFSPARQAEDVGAFYEAVLRAKGRRVRCVF
jgi:glycosyltransferase involved in cell wall biosynthesis